MSEKVKDKSESGDSDVKVLGKYIHEHTNVQNPPSLKVQVERGQRGGYGWTITLEGETWETLKQALKIIDADLKAAFPIGEGVK